MTRLKGSIFTLFFVFIGFNTVYADFVKDISMRPVQTQQALADAFANNIGAQRGEVISMTYASENRGIWRNIDHHVFGPYVAAPILWGALKAFDVQGKPMEFAEEMVGQRLYKYIWDVEFKVVGINHFSQNEKAFIIRCKLEENLNDRKVYLSKCQPYDESGEVLINRSAIEKSLLGGGTWIYLFEYSERPQFLKEISDKHDLTSIPDPQQSSQEDKPVQQLWDEAPPLTSRPVPVRQ